MHHFQYQQTDKGDFTKMLQKQKSQIVYGSSSMNRFSQTQSILNNSGVPDLPMTSSISTAISSNALKSGGGCINSINGANAPIKNSHESTSVAISARSYGNTNSNMVSVTNEF